MKISRFIRSRAGRRLYNFAYCWGACLVILGAVFKIAHMPFDTILLMIGLFTEVTIFFISGFDTPPEYEWEKVFPQLGDDRVAGIAADKEIRKKLDEGTEAIESRLRELNQAYEGHIREIRRLTDTIDPRVIADLQKETADLAALLKQLNSRYSGMLSAMGQDRK